MNTRIKLFVAVLLFSVLPIITIGVISSFTSGNNALLVSFGLAGFILIICHISGQTSNLVNKAISKLVDKSKPVGFQETSSGKNRAACQMDQLFENLNCAFAHCEMIYDDERNPCDFLYLKINPAFKKILNVEDLTGKRLSDVFPDIEQSCILEYDEILKTGNPASFQRYNKVLKKWWQIFGFKTGENKFGIIFYDITELKEGKEKLEYKVDLLQEKVDVRSKELRRANLLLVEQMEALHAYENKLRSLASKLTMSEERERHRLASGIHDNIIQPLVFLDIKLGILLQKQFDTNTIDVVTEMKGIISKLIKMARGFNFELSYPVLYEIGLEAAIEDWLSEEIQAKTEINTIFCDDNKPKPVSKDLRSFLFDSVRELLVNTVKHSKAKNLKIDISRQNDIIVIKVEDDGIGFDTKEDISQVGKDSGFGLFSIRERLTCFEGFLEISSKPGEGTAVTLKAPLTLNNREEERVIYAD